MGVLTKQEFRDLCGGITAQYLNMAIKRGKVIIDDDGMINPNEFINADYVFRRQQKRVPVIKEKKHPKAKSKKEVIEKPLVGIQEKIDFEPGNISQLEREKKEIELKKLKKELELKEIEVAKKLGELIPVDVVKGLVGRFQKNYVSAFHHCAERLSQNMVSILGANREQHSNFRGELVKEINKAIDESIEVTDSELEGIINEYKAVKGR